MQSLACLSPLGVLIVAKYKVGRILSVSKCSKQAFVTSNLSTTIMTRRTSVSSN